MRKCLNPFRSGQCLSTQYRELGTVDEISQSLSIRAMSFDKSIVRTFTTIYCVSIPFDQGNVFRLQVQFVHKDMHKGLNPFRSGQCLSTINKVILDVENCCLNPFRAGRCLSTI